MKNLITLTLVFLPLCAFPQSEPFKGAKTIIINCEDSSEVLYKRLGRHLISKGAIIDESNADFLTLQTAPMETTRYNLLFYVNATVITNKVRLNTFYKINTNTLVGVGASSFDTWTYAKGKDNAMNVIYLDLMKLLNDFESVSIEYQK